MNEEMTELLIGKFLDSEITPAEQQLLDKELQNNPQSRQLLQELKQIHELTGQVLESELNDAETSPEEIFARASAQVPPEQKPRRLNLNWWLRTVAAAAAVLVLSFGLKTIIDPFNLENPQITSLPPVVVDNTPTGTEQAQPARPVRYGPESDFYYVRGPDGIEYLIERPNQNQLRRAVYNNDIH